MLAGLPNAPSVYSPTKNPDLAKKRQSAVLNAMVKYGYLDQAVQDDQVFRQIFRKIRRSFPAAQKSRQTVRIWIHGAPPLCLRQRQQDDRQRFHRVAEQFLDVVHGISPSERFASIIHDAEHFIKGRDIAPRRRMYPL